MISHLLHAISHLSHLLHAHVNLRKIRPTADCHMLRAWIFFQHCFFVYAQKEMRTGTYLQQPDVFLPCRKHFQRWVCCWCLFGCSGLLCLKEFKTHIILYKQNNFALGRALVSIVHLKNRGDRPNPKGVIHPLEGSCLVCCAIPTPIFTDWTGRCMVP